MHYQFLIEDQSSAVLIELLMKKILVNNPDTTFDIKPFKGIGGFTKKNTVKETKTGKLLNDLATYMRGFCKSLQHIEASLFVVLDNDDRNTKVFRSELESVAQQNQISMDYVFCIAIEEVEAWLLGDRIAIENAYPHLNNQILKHYVQDSICGTWELLANVVHKGGLSKLKNASFHEIGRLKCEWAKNIGQYMDIDNNDSPSFNYFLTEIRKRLPAV